MILFVAGSTDSMTGPFPPHFPLKTPGIGAEDESSVGKSNLVKISLMAEVVAVKSIALTFILDFSFDCNMRDYLSTKM